MAPNLQKFCRAIALAKLVSPADLEKDYRTWRVQQPNERDNLTSFASHLVKNKRLTQQQLIQFLKPPTTDAPPDSKAATTDDYFDVELVPIRDPRRRFDRRDVMMIVGGAVVASAVVFPLTYFLTK